jgi:hypothetical protein
MPEYVPDPVGAVKDLTELLEYLTRELQKVSNTVGVQGAYPELHKEPSRKDGTVAFADGTDWNPGQGRGLYAFYSGAWNALFQPAEDEPEGPPELPPTPPEPPAPEEAIFTHSFETSITENGFYTILAKAPTRASLVNTARIGTKGVQLRTAGNDTGIGNSGGAERCDLVSTAAKSNGFEGRESWWAWSLYLPDEFQIPPPSLPNHWYVTLQWHCEPSNMGGGQGPMVCLYILNYAPSGSHFVWRVKGGTTVVDHRVNPFGTEEPQKNIWYDFVQHVIWSLNPAVGRTRLWARKGNAAQYDLKDDWTGGNLYVEAPAARIQPSNYHSNSGVASAIIYDRIVHGLVPYSVAMAPLEGVPA